jgi:hypothetical protein
MCLERATGVQRSKKGYRGHDASNPYRLFTSDQKCGVIGATPLRHRAVISYMKADVVGETFNCAIFGRFCEVPGMAVRAPANSDEICL